MVDAPDPRRAVRIDVALATSAGSPDRPNEDFVAAVPGAVVLLDGAGITGTEDICRHGVAWYARTLGASLLARLGDGDGADLVATLADSIDQVAQLHRHTCDIGDPSSPQSTIAMIRLGEDRLDYLVLADAYVLVDASVGDPLVVRDRREVDVRRECSVPLSGLAPGTPDYERALPSVIDALRARRNQPGGYWIAKDDPVAAAHAVTGAVPLDSLRGVALLSNGASRLVDPYELMGWPELTGLLRTGGPDELIRQVRRAETAGGAGGALPGAPGSDDATAAYVRMAGR